MSLQEDAAKRRAPEGGRWMPKQMMTTLKWFAAAVMLCASGCASIEHRKTKDGNLYAQSMWKYDRGPYPAIRRVFDSPEDEKTGAEAARDKDIPFAIAVPILIVLTPIWLADLLISTAFDTVMLPYDLYKME